MRNSATARTFTSKHVITIARDAHASTRHADRRPGEGQAPARRAGGHAEPQLDAGARGAMPRGRRVMTQRLERLRRRLSGSVCGQSLAAFRIAFGLLMLHDTVYVLRAGWLTRYYVERDILFPYFGVEVPVAPEPWLHGLWAVCTVCCVLVALGALYRLAIWVFNAVFTYFFLLDQVVYLNHFYMIILFGVLLGCTGAHRCWFARPAARARRREPRGPGVERGGARVPDRGHPHLRGAP